MPLFISEPKSVSKGCENYYKGMNVPIKTQLVLGKTSEISANSKRKTFKHTEVKYTHIWFAFHKCLTMFLKPVFKQGKPKYLITKVK